MNAQPTYSEVNTGARIDFEERHSSALSRAIIELLPVMNAEYFLEHQKEIDPELCEAKKYLSCSDCGECGCDCEVKEEGSGQ